MSLKIGRACAFVAMGAFVLVLAACDGLPTLSGGDSGTGTLKLHVTDKPFPFDLIESAVVTLTRVEVRKADPANEELEESNDSAQSEPVTEDDEASAAEETFITVFEDAEGKPFDLVDLRNGRTDLLAVAELPAGKYTQLRLIVSGGEVTLTDGRVFPLKVPSGEQSGIKLRFTFEVVDEEETSLLLDVDLSRAFTPIPGGKIQHAGDIRQFHFKPSLAVRLVDLAEMGEVAGTVTDASGQPIANAAVTVYEGDVEITSTSTEADGTYALIGLPAGTYRVEFSALGYAEQEILEVFVVAGQATPDVNAALVAE
jgi:hypothetical protein